MSTNSRLVLERSRSGELSSEGSGSPFPFPKKISKILLLDGYSTRSLACVRSWGKKKVPFAVGGETRWDMSLFSKYAAEKFVYTSPKRDVSKFMQDVNRYCREFGADAVFPTSEAAIMACSRHAEELAAIPIIPRRQEMETVFSKANTLKIAESLGIAVPRTLHVTKRNFQCFDSRALRFPVAVKSESSEVLLSTHAATSGKTSYISNPTDLKKECASRLAKGQFVLVQEFIDGYGIGVSGLFDEGRPVAILGHRRIRESNPFGGPSAVAETIPVEPRLLNTSVELLKAIGFSGPAMVEYKVDYRTNEPYLMEINGRFWGTILLAPAAGLDLPYLYWKMLNGIEIRPEETRYQVGFKGRYLVGDTKCLFLSLKGKPASWPGRFAGRWETLQSYSASFFDRQTKELLFSADDPLPFFARLVQDLI